MPELVKVEQMMLDFTLEVEQAKLIIRRFDETMTHKAEKVSIDQIYLHCDKTYGSKASLEENITLVKNSIE